MDQVIFSYRSSRAAKARFGRRITPFVRRVLVVAIFLLIATGVVLLIYTKAFGWLFIALASLLYILFEWDRGELDRLKPTGGQKVNDIMSADALGALPKDVTPKDIASAISKTTAGNFLALRLGITSGFLFNLASDDPRETAKLWQEALTVRSETGSELVNGAVLAVSLIMVHPERDSLLAHLNIDAEDLKSVVRWYNQLSALIEKTRTPKRTGGIARDFSFGYIPLLKRFGQNISMMVSNHVELESHRDVLDRLMATFGNSGRQNVVLVGGEGVGKTTIVRAFAERLLDADAKIPENLKFRQVFMLDSASLIAAAPGRGELEGLIMHVLSEAYSAKNIIICLDNAQLFFEEGVGSVDLTNVLLPILEAGRLRVILTMDEQRLLQISQKNPGLVNALNRVNLAPASKPETLQIMQDQLITVEYTKNVSFTYQSLVEAYRLSERYVHDLSMPGRALKLMDSAADFSESGLVTEKSVQQAIESTIGVKVGVANDEGEREKLLNLEKLIHERMINQSHAVEVVSDALRRARAGVRNENRPIGTFLFLGPTGVGKTELSKALADVYFGGENDMIRLDLNEYVRAEDVTRLIADGANDPTSLTAQAMKKPFSVVLLDEIEKAHPQVLTTLLQLLDEGVLRDIKNREVSFRDTIVVATSNAGADRIREYIEKGYQLEQFEDKFIDELINTNQFRPEFLNRFDEIVVFRPLNKTELIQVLDLILAGVNKTLELQKISVVVADDAKLYLVDKGYDPRLGARPMRRMVQRAVENIVAKQMLSSSVSPGTVIQITLDQVRQVLEGERTDTE